MTAAARTIRVLVIDDEPDIVEALRWCFKRDAVFTVETALCCEEALARAKSFSPDVILLDLVMPATDGWEVLRRLRQVPETESVPVVMMTAQDGAAEEEKVRGAGVHKVLVKPLDIADLLETVRSAVPAG